MIGVSCCIYNWTAPKRGGMFKSPIYLPPYTDIYPLYRTPIFAELFRRIPITAIKHIDLGINGILINVRNHTINGIILLYKLFLPNIFRFHLSNRKKSSLPRLHFLHIHLPIPFLPQCFLLT